MAKVSIIIPIYNAEEYLEQCLDSVANQTLNDIEIICVDNGSIDNSINMVESYVSKDKRFKYIKADRMKNTGYARNIGLANATGDYVMLLDSDDWYEPTSCEDAYNQISRNNNDIVFFNYQCYFEYNKTYKACEYLDLLGEYKSEPQIRLYDIDTEFFGSYHCMAIYKREFLNKNSIKYSNTLHNQDVPFRIKALVYADTVSVLDKVLYNYRIIRKGPKQRDYNNFIQYFYNVKLSFKELLNSPHKDEFIKPFAIKYVRQVLRRTNHFRKYHPPISMKNKLFAEIHKTLVLFSKHYDIEQIKDKIKYKKYRKYYKYTSLYDYWMHITLLSHVLKILNLPNRKNKDSKLEGKNEKV